MAFVAFTWERVNRGVPEEDALLLAEELRHRAELSDVARNLAARIEEQARASVDEDAPRGVESAAVVSGYRYRVHFEDGRDVTTNYVGEVLQVGDDITLEGRQWVITDAKVLSERDVDFEIQVGRAEEE